MIESYYKIARTNGWDFFTGRTINYRMALAEGKPVSCPDPNPAAGLCSAGVLHASKRAEACFQGGELPCSLFIVRGKAVCSDSTKSGFIELEVVEELLPENFFRWRYAEALNPLNPLTLTPPVIDDAVLELLTAWDSVRDSAWASARASVADSVGASAWARVWASVAASVGASTRASVADSVRDSVGASVWASVADSVRASVGASVWAYIGYIFAPVVEAWKERYPFQSAVDLWKLGLVPSYDGSVWRLHGGPRGGILYTQPR